MRQLAVYINDTKVGVLTENTPGQGYCFQYDPKYVISSNKPVSVNLPVRDEPYTSDYLFPLFSNMLPEGGNRRVICRVNHIDENDLFGLLTLMADQDFIGAVNVRKISQ